MRTTLTLDDDVTALLQKEVRRSGEPLKQTVNRLLRSGLNQTANPPKPKRFIVEPLDLGITAKQWKKWDGMKMHDILDEAEGPLSR